MKRLKRIIRFCREYQFFLGLFLLMNLIFAFFLWLTDAPSFRVVVGLFLCITLLLLGGVFYVIEKKEEKKRNAFSAFLENPSPSNLLNVQMLSGEREKGQLNAMGERLKEDRQKLQEEQRQREDYEEYIEMWAHEIKVPLSLLTLMLDNRKEEMTQTVYQRLVYVASQIQDNVTQMLYYARLGAAHKDYLWEQVSLLDCIEEAVQQYEPVFREGELKVICEVSSVCVFTDKKGILMILGQVLNNAYKYRDTEKEKQWVRISDNKDEERNRILLTVADNGIGMKQSDLPFLFEKGFTGDTDERKKKATGMGLYLVEQMARNLKLELDVESVYGEGLTFTLAFPIVE
ncbi:MAG: sensor histidine kinase [Lachnospiraceae bacterium]|nr:sensor histidine kinase [Lachnospiraceae bacterium]